MASEIEEVVAAGSEFPQFDVVTDFSDHHFAGLKGQTGACFSNARSGVYRKIMQEWKILGENLPETIFVRTYEERIDLLRAVIIGAKGTPYHDGLFFFDIAFPEDYPTSPPKVHYHSFGLRVNPNLYATGRVCLSLLNTWAGKKSEKWNPLSSSILQILVSIQALVLNVKPYYNEPGLKPASNYKIYNEKVFALNCKTMCFLIRTPPRHFKEFVIAHFRERGYSILQAIDAYRKGVATVDFVVSKTKKVPYKISKSSVKELEYIYKLLFADLSQIKAPGIEDLRPAGEESATDKATDPAAGNPTQAIPKVKKSLVGYILSKVKKVFKITHTKSILKIATISS